MRSLSVKKMLGHARLALIGGAILGLQGCGVIYKTTGVVDRVSGPCLDLSGRQRP